MEISIEKILVTEPQTKIAANIALHKIGEENKPVVFCVHGLTRNATDFYPLAKVLADDYHVIMMDMVGRGESDYLALPELYNNAFYASITAALLDQLGLKQLRWIGTSMGGLVGMILAATHKELISKLLLNDIGYMIPREALLKIKEYVGVNMASNDYEMLVAVVKENLRPFGIEDASVFEHFVSHSIIADGTSWRLNYDGYIRKAFAEIPDEDANIYDIWKLIQQPTLIIRGENSGLLLEETAKDMAEREKTELYQVPRAGHAPSLSRADEIERIQKWLSS